MAAFKSRLPPAPAWGLKAPNPQPTHNSCRLIMETKCARVDTEIHSTYLPEMGKNKSAGHHWWPECVSRLWADDAGGVHWLLPDGEVRRAKPSSFGVIGNGHFIKLGNKPGEVTPWDQNFKSEFQNADNSFPAIIEWLENLDYQPRIGTSCPMRFVPQPSSDALFAQMVESLASLAIRSPMTREKCVSFAERFRGRLSEWERNSLITANMRDMLRCAVQAFGVSGKATAILSPHREFIFGDGFYHNLTSPSMAPHSPRILAPLTPRLAVLYAQPMQYTVEPRLSTLVVDAQEADALNQVVQVYAREKLFFRSDKPELIDEYRGSKHLHFSSSRNIAEAIVHDMPGVPPRDTSFDFLEDMALRR